MSVIQTLVPVAIGYWQDRVLSTEGDGDGLPNTIAESLVAPDPTVRETGVQELAAAALEDVISDQHAVSILGTRCDEDGNTDVRVAACEALGQIGTDRARSLLETHRLNPDPEVSHTASRGLRATNL